MIMMHKLWIWFWICLLKSCNGIQVNILNIAVVVGHTVKLPCYTTLSEPVDWRYQKNATIEEDYVCLALAPYEKGVTDCKNYIRWPRISVNSSTPGDYTLTVHNVTISDSGLYHCVEVGAGMRHTFQLTVLLPDVNECLSQPCQYGGVCIDGINMYTCKCRLGFAGINCETDMNECSSKPCQNGGDCRHGINAYMCVCPPNFTGISCETVVHQTEHLNEDKLSVPDEVIIIVVVTFIVIVSQAVLFVLVCLWRRKKNHRNENLENEETIPLKSQDTSDPYRLPSGSLQTRPLARRTKNSVRGLATLDSKWYVLYVNKIAVFVTQPPYKRLKSIRVKGLNDPQEIAACSINNCLYVNDRLSEYVWKVEMDYKADKRFEKWLKAKDIQIMSVTLEGHLVLLIDELVNEGNESFRRSSVNIYRADGAQLSSLELPDVDKPWNVIQTGNKSFIVCHGGSESKLHRVSEVNTAGVVVISYGGSRGSELRELDEPRDIALFKEEQVFVADFNNRRVLLLDNQLKIQLVLLNWLQDKPRRLIYDPASTQLMVLVTSDDGVDKVEITNCNFDITHKRHNGRAMGIQKNLKVEKSEIFDDGVLVDPGKRIYVTGMKFYTRKWDGLIVIGGLQIFYSTGDTVEHGKIPTDNNLAEFHLEKDELIVSVTAFDGTLLDSLTFRTSHGRTLGSFGGPGGFKQEIECQYDPQHQSKPYLAYLKGRVDITEGDTAVRHLEFFWGFYEYTSW